MAENSKIYFGTGVQVNGSLDVLAIGRAGDSRLVVKSPEGLAELVEAKRVYDGMLVYCESDQTYHKCRVVWDEAYNVTSCTWKQVEILSEEELVAIIGESTTAAMRFKGTITDGALPTNGANGDMYKVANKDLTIPKDKNAESVDTDAVAKPGDSIVCEIVRLSDTDYVKWYLIPSGDDVEDTWRAIKVNGVEKLGIGTTTGVVDFQQGANVTITEAGGVITIAAEDTHHQAKLVATSNSTNGDNAEAENGNVYLNLVENGVVRSSHKIVGTGVVTVTSGIRDNEDTIIVHAPEGISRSEVEGIVSDAVDGAKDELSAQNIAILAEAQKYTDNAVDGLHEIATTGSLYDAEEANIGTDKDGNEVRYFVLDCNW